MLPCYGLDAPQPRLDFFEVELRTPTGQALPRIQLDGQTCFVGEPGQEFQVAVTMANYSTKDYKVGCCCRQLLMACMVACALAVACSSYVLLLSCTPLGVSQGRWAGRRLWQDIQGLESQLHRSFHRLVAAVRWVPGTLLCTAGHTPAPGHGHLQCFGLRAYAAAASQLL